MQIVDSNVPVVLGLKSNINMNLVNPVYTVNKNWSTESIHDLMQKYEYLFHDIWSLHGRYAIKTDTDVSRVVAPPRRVSYALKEKVQDETKMIEEMDIISKVRIRLDQMELNKAITKGKDNEQWSIS